MVVLIKVVCSSLLQEERIGGPGGVGLVAVAAEFRAGGIIFRNQTFVGVEEVGLHAPTSFHSLLPEGVVLIEDISPILASRLLLRETENANEQSNFCRPDLGCRRRTRSAVEVP